MSTTDPWSPERGGRARRRRPIAAAVLLVGALPLVAGCFGGDKTPVTELGEEGVGVCLAIDESVDAEIDDLPAVDCTEPHTHEIFAVVRSTADTYPGFEALEQEAQVACLEAFEGYVGISPFDSNLFYSWMVPTLASWEDNDIVQGNVRGDREIICVVGSSDGEPLTSTVRDSGR